VPEIHDFEYESDFLEGGLRAACSCGWSAREVREDLMEAHEDWDNHCDQVFMEATGG
jgi:hypothetical protein